MNPERVNDLKAEAFDMIREYETIQRALVELKQKIADKSGEIAKLEAEAEVVSEEN